MATKNLASSGDPPEGSPRGSTLRTKRLQPHRPSYRVRRHGRVLECTPITPRFLVPDHPSWNHRGKIKGLSHKSLTRHIRMWSRIPEVHGVATLTFGANWRYVAGDSRNTKKKLSNLLQKLRKKIPEVEGGVWMLEFQARGAPHFHVFTIDRAKANSIPDWKERSRWLKESWIAYGGGHQTRWEEARYPDAASRYIAKSREKRYQKLPPLEWKFPGRYFGRFGKVDLLPVEDLGIVGNHDELKSLGVRFRDDEIPYWTSYPAPGGDGVEQSKDHRGSRLSH